MKYKNLLTKGLSSTVLALVLPMFSQLSSAESITCNLDTVTLTSISLTGGAEVYNAGSNASYCVGPFMGENDDSLSHPNPNIGQLNDGILNGEGKNGATGLLTNLHNDFNYDLQDVDGVDGANDPGWIHLLGFQAGNGDNPTYDTIGIGSPFAVDIATLLTFEFGDGLWELSVKLDAFDLLSPLLGDNVFDHLAFSFKAGNNFSVYDFDFSDNPGAIFNNFLPLTAYTFNGTYDITGEFPNGSCKDKDNGKEKECSGAGLSHFNLWAHDPPVSESVPEPAILFLFGLALIALVISSRRKVLLVAKSD